MHWHWVMLFIACTIYIHPINAQPTQIDLNDALELAFLNHRQLQIAALQVDHAEVMKKTAFSPDKTQLFYEYDENNIAENGFSLHVFGMAQSFEFPTVYKHQKNVSQQQVYLAEMAGVQQKHLVAKNVAQAYYAVQYVLNKQQVYAQIDSMYLRFKEGFRAGFEQGTVSRLDALNAAAKRQQLTLQIKHLSHALEIAYVRLYEAIQCDSGYRVQMEDLQVLPLKGMDVTGNTGLKQLQMEGDLHQMQIRLEKQKMLPDLSVGYFVGTNSHPVAHAYQGVLLGVAVPLFYGEQSAKVKAGEIQYHMHQKMQEQYRYALQAQYQVLKTEATKYREAIDFYEQSGKALSQKLIATTEESYAQGEINFYEFVLSIENALQLTLDYLDNVAGYNRLVLEMNYLNR